MPRALYYGTLWHTWAQFWVPAYLTWVGVVVMAGTALLCPEVVGPNKRCCGIVLCCVVLCCGVVVLCYVVVLWFRWAPPCSAPRRSAPINAARRPPPPSLHQHPAIKQPPLQGTPLFQDNRHHCHWQLGLSSWAWALA